MHIMNGYFFSNGCDGIRKPDWTNGIPFIEETFRLFNIHGFILYSKKKIV